MLYVYMSAYMVEGTGLQASKRVICAVCVYECIYGGGDRAAGE